MSVDATLAYTLARQTGLGAELCKMALERSKHDVEAALKILKRWGGTKLTSNKSKSFGAVCTYFEADHAAVVEVTCTDELLSKSKPFYELVGQITTEVVNWGEPYVAEPAAKELEAKHKCSINIKSVRFERTNKLCLLTTYTHRDVMGVMLETEVATEDAFNNRQFRLFSFDLAMHIAAFNPLAVSKTAIPENIKQEVQLQIEKQLAQEGKDIKFWPIALEGKMSKWMEQHSLLTQIFAKSDKETVDDMKKKIGDKIGSEITIKRFARFALGS